MKLPKFIQQELLNVKPTSIYTLSVVNIGYKIMNQENNKFNITDWLILYSSMFLIAFMLPGAVFALYAGLFTAEALLTSYSLAHIFSVAIGGYVYRKKLQKLRENKSPSDYKKLRIPVLIFGGAIFLLLMFLYL